MKMPDQLERGRDAFARQAWGDAFAELSAADSGSPLELDLNARDRLRLGIVERLVALKPGQ